MKRQAEQVKSQNKQVRTPLLGNKQLFSDKARLDSKRNETFQQQTNGGQFERGVIPSARNSNTVETKQLGQKTNMEDLKLKEQVTKSEVLGALELQQKQKEKATLRFELQHEQYIKSIEQKWKETEERNKNTPSQKSNGFGNKIGGIKNGYSKFW